MSKFTVVTEAPKELNKDEIVIEMPTFLDEIRDSRIRRPATGVTGVHYLRAIAELIGNKYDPEFNAFRNIRPVLYENQPIKSDQAISQLVLQMFNDTYPKIVDSYLDHKIKNRPANTRVIYFVGPYDKSKIFLKNGIDLVTESSEEPKAIKKATGKPFKTDSDYAAQTKE